MKSVTTLTLRVPATLLGDSSDADCVLSITNESEETAQEYSLTSGVILNGVRELAALVLSKDKTGKQAPAPAEPDQDPASWTGLFCSDTGTIIGVRPGSPADIAGIVPGDRVLAIDGFGYGLDAIGPNGKWSQLADATAPGEPMYVDIERPVSICPAGYTRKTLVRPRPAGPVS